MNSRSWRTASSSLVRVAFTFTTTDMIDIKAPSIAMSPAMISQLIMSRPLISRGYIDVDDHKTVRSTTALRGCKHSGGTAVKLLFLIRAAEDGREDALPEAVERFSDVLSETLGAQAAILQSKPTQFFVLLPRRQDGEAIAAHVLEAWGKTEGHDKTDVTYVLEEMSF